MVRLFFYLIRGWVQVNASVPLIKLRRGTVLFFAIYFPEKAHVGLPIGEDNMLFTPHYALSYFVLPVWQIENVLTYNLAKSTLYLHRDTFFFFFFQFFLHPVLESINLPYLWTLQMSNTVNRAGFN